MTPYSAEIQSTLFQQDLPALSPAHQLGWLFAAVAFIEACPGVIEHSSALELKLQQVPFHSLSLFRDCLWTCEQRCVICCVHRCVQALALTKQHDVVTVTGALTLFNPVSTSSSPSPASQPQPHTVSTPSIITDAINQPDDMFALLLACPAGVTLSGKPLQSVTTAAPFVSSVHKSAVYPSGGPEAEGTDGYEPDIVSDGHILIDTPPSHTNAAVTTHVCSSVHALLTPLSGTILVPCAAAHSCDELCAGLSGLIWGKHCRVTVSTGLSAGVCACVPVFHSGEVHTCDGCGTGVCGSGMTACSCVCIVCVLYTCHVQCVC